MEYKAKSVVFGRKPRSEGNEFKTAFFKIYLEESPMSSEVMSSFPVNEIDFPNVEFILIKDCDVHYYLEGNDIVIDNISSINIEQEENSLILSVKK